MIYNTEKQKPNKNSYCLDCPFWTSENNLPKTCKGGMGKRCFEMDMFGNLIDPITKATIKNIEEEK